MKKMPTTRRTSLRNVCLLLRISAVLESLKTLPWSLVLLLSMIFCIYFVNFTTVDGKSLGFALEKELSKTFLELAIMCKAVICCGSELLFKYTSHLILSV